MYLVNVDKIFELHYVVAGWLSRIKQYPLQVMLWQVEMPDWSDKSLAWLNKNVRLSMQSEVSKLPGLLLNRTNHTFYALDLLMGPNEYYTSKFVYKQILPLGDIQFKYRNKPTWDHQFRWNLVWTQSSKSKVWIKKKALLKTPTRTSSRDVRLLHVQ